jgi:hypothetical protein
MDQIIFFSWSKIEKRCKGDLSCIANTFKKFTTTPVPSELSGNSFILNIKGLFSSKDFLDHEVVEYLYLCSLRNHFDYKYQNNARLYLYFSNIPLDRMSRNKLLKIENDYIKFIYEENHGN